MGGTYAFCDIDTLTVFLPVVGSFCSHTAVPDLADPELYDAVIVEPEPEHQDGYDLRVYPTDVVLPFSVLVLVIVNALEPPL